MRKFFPIVAILLLIHCEHFFGRIFRDEELIAVPGLSGKWRIIEKGKVNGSLDIREQEKNFEYVILVEKNKAILRFVKIKETTIGEYHEFDDFGKEKKSGHFFTLKKNSNCFDVIVGQDITGRMVSKYHLKAELLPSYTKKVSDSFVLSGTPAENRSAIEKLALDPDFFPMKTKAELSLCR